MLEFQSVRSVAYEIFTRKSLIKSEEPYDSIHQRNKLVSRNDLAVLCAKDVEAVYSPLLAVVYISLVLSSDRRTQGVFVLQTVVYTAINSGIVAVCLEPDANRFLANKLKSAHGRLWPGTSLTTP